MQPTACLQTDSLEKLALYEWKAQTVPRAALLIVHGFAEHAGRYDHFASFLSDRAVDVFALDLRGHGRSSGEEAFINDLGEYLEDVAHACEYLQQNTEAKDHYILGHSGGGLVVVKAILDLKPSLRGVILSGAALKIDPDLSPLLRRLTPFLARLIPHVAAVKLDSHLISKDQEVVKKYLDDPHVYTGGIKIGYGAAMLRAIKETQTRFSEFTDPVLVLHGALDKLTDPAGSRIFAKEVASEDVTHHELEGLFHEILNEPEKHMVYDLIGDWIDQRSPRVLK